MALKIEPDQHSCSVKRTGSLVFFSPSDSTKPTSRVAHNKLGINGSLFFWEPPMKPLNITKQTRC